MEKAVRFATGKSYDDDAGTVWLTAFANHRMIPCAVELRSMASHLHCSEPHSLACFCKWRAQFERLMEHLIAKQRFEPDGSVHLRWEDSRALMLDLSQAESDASILIP
jgi:hypothetical protein